MLELSAKPHVLFRLAHVTKYFIITFHYLRCQNCHQWFIKRFEICDLNINVIKVFLLLGSYIASLTTFISGSSSSKIISKVLKKTSHCWLIFGSEESSLHCIKNDFHCLSHILLLNVFFSLPSKSFIKIICLNCVSIS